MFSVIIPLYNKAIYVEKAIWSVLNQTCQEFELILVNDGSTDDPLPPNGGDKELRLQKFGSFNHKITIIEQRNQGVSVARNNGVKIARYDYIAFLDADDWWEPTFLEQMKGLIEEFPQAGIYGSSYFIVKNGKFIQADIGVDAGFKHGPINYLQVYAKTLYMPLTSISTIIKKEIFVSEHGFKPLLKLGEDFDLWIRVCTKYPAAFLNIPLAFYNQDVDLKNRAIGLKLYEPEQHMLFTNYGDLTFDPSFRNLYEKLAVYSLLPYYLENKNKKEIDLILNGINWKNHGLKDRLCYMVLPKKVVKLWLKFLKYGSMVKKKYFTDINKK